MAMCSSSGAAREMPFDYTSRGSQTGLVLSGTVDAVGTKLEAKV